MAIKFEDLCRGCVHNGVCSLKEAFICYCESIRAVYNPSPDKFLSIQSCKEYMAKPGVRGAVRGEADEAVLYGYDMPYITLPCGFDDSYET